MILESVIRILLFSIGVHPIECAHYGSIKIDMTHSESSDFETKRNESETLPDHLWEHISEFAPCSALNGVNRYGFELSGKTKRLCASEIDSRFESLLSKTQDINLNISDLSIFQPVVTHDVRSIKLSMTRYLQHNHIGDIFANPFYPKTVWKGIESNTDNLFLLFVLTRIWPFDADDHTHSFCDEVGIARIGILLVVFHGDTMDDNHAEMNFFRCSYSRWWLCKSRPPSSLNALFENYGRPISVHVIARLIKDRLFGVLNTEPDSNYHYEDWKWGKVTKLQLWRAQNEIRDRRRTCAMWTLGINQILSLVLMFTWPQNKIIFQIAILFWTTGSVVLCMSALWVLKLGC